MAHASLSQAQKAYALPPPYLPKTIGIAGSKKFPSPRVFNSPIGAANDSNREAHHACSFHQFFSTSFGTVDKRNSMDLDKTKTQHP